MVSGAGESVLTDCSFRHFLFTAFFTRIKVMKSDFFERKPESRPSESEMTKEQLKVELRFAADELRREKFDVDNECRIKPESFAGILPDGEMNKDVFAVEDLERKFALQPQSEAANLEGENLEMAVTLGFNKYWFKKQFLAVRTAKYDDYVNGVDSIIFHRATGEAMAAIDTTLDLSAKMKKGQLQEKIRFGSPIKYGYKLHPTKGVEKNPHHSLPLFIISFTPDELRKSIKNYDRSEAVILNSLIQEAQIFPTFPKISSDMKEAYGRIYRLLLNLKQGK